MLSMNCFIVFMESKADDRAVIDFVVVAWVLELFNNSHSKSKSSWVHKSTPYLRYVSEGRFFLSSNGDRVKAIGTDPN